MAKTLIGHDSRLEQASLSGGIYQTALGRANAVDRALAKVARTKASAARELRLVGDLGADFADYPVRVLSAHGHNGSQDLRMRVQAARRADAVGDPDMLLDFLAGWTDGRTYPNDLDPRVTFSRASGGTLWRDGQLFGHERVTRAATALDTTVDTWTVRAGGKWQAGDLVYVLPQDGTANISLTATVASYAGTTLTLTGITAGSDTTTTKTDFALDYRGPRLDSHPVTKERRGLLLEPAATNMFTAAEDSSSTNLDTGWGVYLASNTQNQGAAPDGANTLSLCTATGGSDVHLTQLRRGTIASPYDGVVSVFVRAKGTHRVSLRLRADTYGHGYEMAVDLSAGTIVSTAPINSGTLNGSWIEDVGGGIYRLSIAVNFTSASNGVGAIAEIYLEDTAGNQTFAPNATEAESVYVWGWHGNVNEYVPSAYVWAGAAARTRAADVASMTGANFSAWYSQDAGSWLWDFAIAHQNSSTFSPHWGEVTDATATHVFWDYQSAGLAGVKVYDGVSVTSADISTARRDPGPCRHAVAYAGDNFAQSVDGRAVATDSAGKVNSAMNALYFCTRSGGGQIGGWLRGVAYWRRRLANARLVAMASPGAVLDIDFTRATVDLPPGLVHTRATVGTYEDADGVTQGTADFVIASQAAATGALQCPVGPGGGWTVGQRVRAVPQAATPNVAMIGEVTAYADAYATINVIETGSDRSTADTAWTLELLGPRFEFSSGTALGIKLEAADSLTVSGDAFARLHRSDAASLYIEATAPASVAGTQTLISLDDGTANQTVEIRAVAGTLECVILDGGVVQATLSLGSITASAGFAVAAAVSANDFAAVLRGGAVQTDGAGTMPTLDRMNIGQDNAAGDAWGGHVGRLMLIAGRVSDGDLAAMVASGADVLGRGLAGGVGDAASPDYDSGWIPAWTGGAAPSSLYTAYMDLILTAAATYRGWRLDLRDPVTAPVTAASAGDDALALEVGYVGLWRAWQPARNHAFGVEEDHRAATLVSPALSGRRFFDRRARERAHVLAYEHLGEAERQALRDLLALQDVDVPLLLVLDPAAGAIKHRDHYLGRLRSLPALRRLAYARYAAVLAIEEWL